MNYRQPATILPWEETEAPTHELPRSPSMVSTEEVAPDKIVEALTKRYRFDIVSQEVTVPHSVHPLWYIEALGERLNFSRPLAVTIEEEMDGECILSNDTFRIWGIGDSKYTALEDFARTFVAVLRSYDGTPGDELSADAAAYLKRLRALILRREAV